MGHTTGNRIRAGTAAGGRHRILLQAPDITLKGKNQPDFQRALEHNIRHHLQRAGFNWHAGASRGRVCVSVPDIGLSDVNQAVALLQKVPGISAVAATRWIPPELALKNGNEINWDKVESEMVELASIHYTRDASFAVRFNRVDKNLPTTSREMGLRLGDVIRQYTGWDTVNLKKPDQTFYIDAYPDGLYLYANKLKGVGGLPTGTGGRVLALLSGGIDSPVAVFAMARRGCSIDLFHMAASHMTLSGAEGAVVARLACELSRYTRRSRLFFTPYTYFDLALQGKPTGYELVLFRRFLMRIAERLANTINAQALVNGDSLGQVASQTLENLVSSSRCIEMTILRPLVGTNKDEIIDLARRIGTFEISIEPYKDCCALIAKSPKTRSVHEDLSALEQSLLPDYEEILERTLADMLCMEFDCGARVS
jgi:thiamine biosynthesis protein ThiI